MNLFVLDECPAIAATMYCDRHVCKIILEGYQMLSLAHIEHGSQYSHLWNAVTQRNNHVSKWVRETADNYDWTVRHIIALCEQYTIRYKKTHDTQRLVEWCYTNRPELPFIGMTPFRLAVAPECITNVVSETYKIYYARCKRWAKWRLGTPQWFTDLCEKYEPLPQPKRSRKKKKIAIPNKPIHIESFDDSVSIYNQS